MNLEAVFLREFTIYGCVGFLSYKNIANKEKHKHVIASIVADLGHLLRTLYFMCFIACKTVLKLA